MASLIVSIEKLRVFARNVLTQILNQLALLLIAMYRSIGSVWLSGSCRFEPSCSIYAQEAVERHGAWVGGRMAIHRLWRCRPGSDFGYDPVPIQKERMG